MIRVVSGRAEIRGVVTFPLSNNLSSFPGQANSSDGAICWTIIKYDGVIECCSYPGEMLPVCLYISLWPPTEPSVVGPNGLVLGGTTAQRTRLGSDTFVGRSAPSSSSVTSPQSRTTASSVTRASSTTTSRIGGGDRNVSIRARAA